MRKEKIATTVHQVCWCGREACRRGVSGCTQWPESREPSELLYPPSPQTDHLLLLLSSAATQH